MSDAEPRYMGGQAVLEGVMMRGPSTWAVAVRDPDGEIKVDVREVPGWAERYRNIPVVRGVMGLGESLGLGYRALTWSANQQVPEEDQVSEKAMGWAILVAVVFFSAIFIVIPAVAGRSLAGWFHGSFPLVEGIVRMGSVHRVSVGDRVAERHPARVPVSRRRAQGDRCVRERCRAHAGSCAAVQHRARPLRHELLVDRDGHCDPRVFGDSAAEPRLRDRFTRRARSLDRGHQLRGHSPLGAQCAPQVGARADAARPRAAEADDPRSPTSISSRLRSRHCARS